MKSARIEELKKLNLDRNSTESSIRAEFTITLDLWSKLQNDGIDKRLQVIGLLKEEEWEKVIANSMADLDKKEQKQRSLFTMTRISIDYHGTHKTSIHQFGKTSKGTKKY